MLKYVAIKTVYADPHGSLGGRPAAHAPDAGVWREVMSCVWEFIEPLRVLRSADKTAAFLLRDGEAGKGNLFGSTPDWAVALMNTPGGKEVIWKSRNEVRAHRRKVCPPLPAKPLTLTEQEWEDVEEHLQDVVTACNTLVRVAGFWGIAQALEGTAEEGKAALPEDPVEADTQMPEHKRAKLLRFRSLLEGQARTLHSLPAGQVPRDNAIVKRVGKQVLCIFVGGSDNMMRDAAGSVAEILTLVPGALDLLGWEAA